jgi:hypothetical protein
LVKPTFTNFKETINKIKWIPDAEEHDYPAAESFPSLLSTEERVSEMIARLRGGAIVQFRTKDIFKAS